jgi:hypothetical protein
MFGTRTKGVPHPVTGMQDAAGMQHAAGMQDAAFQPLHSPARSEHLRLPGGAAGAECSKISNHADCQCRASTSLLAQLTRVTQKV